MTKPLLYTLAGVAALVVAFVSGRYSVPTKVEMRTEFLTLTQVVRSVHVRQVTDTKWKTVVVTKPDGSSVATTEATTHTDTSTKENENSSKVAASTVATKTETKLPDWQISALVGADLSKALNGSGTLAPTFGIHVQRRVLGPVTLGVFGLSSGVVGLSAGLQL